MCLKLIKIFILFTSILHPSLQLSNECNSIFESSIHPYHCCQYPIADTRRTSGDHCYQKCYSNDSYCCVYDCIYADMKKFENGKLTIEERVMHYEMDILSRKGMKEMWEDVLKETIEKCESLVDIKLNEKEACEMPEFMYMVFACEQHLNFLNCPTFKNTTLCRKLYDFVNGTDKCVMKYGDYKFMRQEFWFYRDLQEESDELDCLVWHLF